MRQSVTYQETLSSPISVVLLQGLVLSAVTALAVPVVFRLFFSAPEGMALVSWGELLARFAAHPPFALLIPQWLVIWLAVWVGNRARITLRDQTLLPSYRIGKRQLRIPLATILSYREKEYHYSLLAQMSPERRENGQVRQIVLLAGYRGPGLELVYQRTRSSFTNLKTLLLSPSSPLETETVVIHFPCSRPRKLMALLDAERAVLSKPDPVEGK